MGSPTDGNSNPQPAYRAELITPGCAHCGHGERYKIVGPGIDPPPDDPDEYLGWTRNMVMAEVDRLNRIFEAGRKSQT